ncbi:Uncharacterized protein ABC855_g749 [[Candida] zeylanoides]
MAFERRGSRAHEPFLDRASAPSNDAGDDELGGGSAAPVRPHIIHRPSSEVFTFNDAAFKSTRSSKHWVHGFALPLTVLKYQPIAETKKFKMYRNSAGEVESFDPRIVVEEVENVHHRDFVQREARKSAIRRPQQGEPPAEASPPPARLAAHDVPLADLLGRNEQAAGFAGFYTVPKTTLRKPKLSRIAGGAAGAASHSLSTAEMPKLAYQTFHNNGSSNYIFGGLLTDRFVDFKHLHIPTDIDPQKISIHFPCELPPHVDKNILMSPYMIHNPHFFLVHPDTNSVTYLDNLSQHDYPRLCSMTSCKVSKRQIFFYGGFEIKVVASDYAADCDRWVVEKRLVLNTSHAYILDTFNLTFTKISLESNDGTIIRGRIGNAIAASSHDEWKDLLHTNPDLEEAYFGKSPLFSDAASNRSSASLNKAAAAAPPISSPPHSRRAASPKPHDARDTIDAVSDKSHYESEPATPVSATPSTLLKSPRADVSRPSRSSTVSGSTSHMSSTKHAMGSVLSKSSKMFHMHSRTSSSQSSASSSTPTSTAPSLSSPLSGTATHRDALGNSPKSGSPQFFSTTAVGPTPTPYQLSNTYSKQVKQHRCNSNQSSGGSRPTSPVAQPMAKPLVSRLNTEASSSSFSLKEEAPERASTPRETYHDLNINKNVDTSHTWTSAKPSAEVTFDGDRKSQEFDSVSIYIFGGFVSSQPERVHTSQFKASDDLFKVVLTFSASYQDYVDFDDVAIVYEMGKHAEDSNYVEGDLWPSPRGFFASSLIDVHTTLEDNCHINVYPSEAVVDDDEDAASHSSGSTASFTSVAHEQFARTRRSASSSTRKSKASTASNVISSETFFFGKALLIQGGCNERHEVFSDFYLYVFSSGKWQTMSTYLYDYFQAPHQPWQDEDIASLGRDHVCADASLIEAELRSCHHHALYYKNEERDYLFFVGGLNNDYLRLFDDKPYCSDKFDVSRVSRFQFASKNYFVSRIMILNLQTQTWRFLRYYYDINHVLSDSFVDQVVANPAWVNARICNVGGSFTLNGKSLTIGHGLMVPVPESKDDLQRFQHQYAPGLLWGGHFRWTFPGL